MRNHLVGLSLTCVAACAVPLTFQTSPRSYDGAIKSAEVVPDLDRRGDLRLCIRNWSVSESARDAVLRKVLDKRGELKGDSAFLEIGSSGFPRYDFIYIAGSQLRSSFAGAEEIDVSGTPIERQLREMSEKELSELGGNARSAADHASCYFLSIRKGNWKKTVAIYGELESSTKNSLVMQMLAAAGKRR